MKNLMTIVGVLFFAGCAQEHLPIEYWPRSYDYESAVEKSSLIGGFVTSRVSQQTGEPEERDSYLIHIPADVPTRPEIAIMANPRRIESWQNFSPKSVGGLRVGSYALLTTLSLGEIESFYTEGLEKNGWTKTDAPKPESEDVGLALAFVKDRDFLEVQVADNFKSKTSNQDEKMVYLFLNPPTPQILELVKDSFEEWKQRDSTISER
ncbi:MAG: hypothetical protein NUW37_08780 [Planctomycetes bacterium]|nr:hypothetical protein [Planctomycetota bacterium]